MDRWLSDDPKPFFGLDRSPKPLRPNMPKRNRLAVWIGYRLMRLARWLGADE